MTMSASTELPPMPPCVLRHVEAEQAEVGELRASSLRQSSSPAAMPATAREVVIRREPAADRVGQHRLLVGVV